MPLRSFRYAPLCAAAFLAGLLGFPASPRGQATELPLGAPISRSFSWKEIGAVRPSNQMARDGQGRVYLADDAGLRLYDAHGWREVLDASAGRVFGVTVGADGLPYVGLFDSFGYVKREEEGGARYVSLADRFPPEAREEQIFERLQSVGDEIWAVSGGKLFIWRPSTERMRVVALEDREARLFGLFGQVYATSRSLFLAKLEGESWGPAFPDAELRERLGRIASVDASETVAWLVTESGAVARFDGVAVEPLASVPDPREDWTNWDSVLALRSGGFALGSPSSGVVVYDARGRAAQLLAEGAGLRSGSVRGLLEDPGRGLWVAQDGGVTIAEALGPVSVYTTANGLRGLVTAIEESEGDLYVATDVGLFRGVPGPRGLQTRFEPVAGVAGCVSLAPTERGLLAGTYRGLYEISGRRVSVIDPALDSSYLVRLERDPSALFVGNYAGTTLFRLGENGWARDPSGERAFSQAHGFAESRDGSVWVKSGFGALRRLRLEAGELRLDEFDVSHGLAPGWINPLRVGNATVFTDGAGGLLAFDSGRGRFVEEQGFEYFPGAGPFGFEEVVQDPSGVVWIARTRGDGRLARAPDRDILRGLQFLSRVADDRAEAVWVGVDGEAWLGSHGGLVRYSPRGASAAPRPFEVWIERVVSLGDGATLYDASEGGKPGRISLPSGASGLRVTARASWTLDPALVAYRFQVGSSPGDLDWTGSPTRDFKELPSGEFSLAAMARGPLGEIAIDESLRASVAAPFYQTRLGFALLILVACLLVFCAYHLRLRALNRMNRHLRDLVAARTAELARKSEALEERNVELERRNNELRELVGKASAAAEAKSRFLAMMSHEIRTPMNGVLGMCSLLADTSPSPEQRSFIDSIESSGDGLLTIIDDILDYTKIEEGMLDLESIEFDLLACVESVLVLLGPQATAKRLDLFLEADKAVRRLRIGDPTRFRQILVNLVGNAVKFTDAGTVRVRMRADPDQGSDGLCIEVQDTGVGIERSKQLTVFEPFFQADVSNVRRFGGTGLGLSISRHIAERMGGAIGVESEPGNGATFTVKLSLPTVTPEQPLWPPSRLEGARAKLFYSDPVSRDYLLGLLRDWGARAEVLDTASLFLSEADFRSDCDVVIIENKLVSFDGWDLASKFLSSEDGEPAIPVALAVDRWTELLRARAAVAPQLGVLTHPFVPSRLREVLLGLLASSRGGEPRLQASPPTAAASPGRWSGVRALVAEDNELNLEVVRLQLERLGVQPQVAADGKQAVEACAARRFDVVFMDVQMPVMDGIEATRRILAQAPTGEGPMIFGLSAGVLQEERIGCFEAGMAGFIRKPFDIRDLEEALDRVAQQSARAP